MTQSPLSNEYASAYIVSPITSEEHCPSPGDIYNNNNNNNNNNKDSIYNNDPIYNKDTIYNKDSNNKDTIYNKDSTYNKDKDSSVSRTVFITSPDHVSLPQPSHHSNYHHIIDTDKNYICDEKYNEIKANIKSRIVKAIQPSGPCKLVVSSQNNNNTRARSQSVSETSVRSAVRRGSVSSNTYSKTYDMDMSHSIELAVCPMGYVDTSSIRNGTPVSIDRAYYASQSKGGTRTASITPNRQGRGNIVRSNNKGARPSMQEHSQLLPVLASQSLFRNRHHTEKYRGAEAPARSSYLRLLKASQPVSHTLAAAGGTHHTAAEHPSAAAPPRAASDSQATARSGSHTMDDVLVDDCVSHLSLSREVDSSSVYNPRGDKGPPSIQTKSMDPTYRWVMGQPSDAPTTAQPDFSIITCEKDDHNSITISRVGVPFCAVTTVAMEVDTVPLSMPAADYGARHPDDVCGGTIPDTDTVQVPNDAPEQCTVYSNKREKESTIGAVDVRHSNVPKQHSVIILGGKRHALESANASQAIPKCNKAPEGEGEHQKDHQHMPQVSADTNIGIKMSEGSKSPRPGHITANRRCGNPTSARKPSSTTSVTNSKHIPKKAAIPPPSPSTSLLKSTSDTPKRSLPNSTLTDLQTLPSILSSPRFVSTSCVSIIPSYNIKSVASNGAIKSRYTPKATSPAHSISKEGGFRDMNSNRIQRNGTSYNSSKLLITTSGSKNINNINTPRNGKEVLSTREIQKKRILEIRKEDIRKKDALSLLFSLEMTLLYLNRIFFRPNPTPGKDYLLHDIILKKKRKETGDINHLSINSDCLGITCSTIASSYESRAIPTEQVVIIDSLIRPMLGQIRRSLQHLGLVALRDGTTIGNRSNIRQSPNNKRSRHAKPSMTLGCNFITNTTETAIAFLSGGECIIDGVLIEGCLSSNINKDKQEDTIPSTPRSNGDMYSTNHPSFDIHKHLGKYFDVPPVLKQEQKHFSSSRQLRLHEGNSNNIDISNVSHIGNVSDSSPYPRTPCVSTPSSPSMAVSAQEQQKRKIQKCYPLTGPKAIKSCLNYISSYTPLMVISATLGSYYSDINVNYTRPLRCNAPLLSINNLTATDASINSRRGHWKPPYPLYHHFLFGADDNAAKDSYDKGANTYRIAADTNAAVKAKFDSDIEEKLLQLVLKRISKPVYMDSSVNRVKRQLELEMRDMRIYEGFKSGGTHSSLERIHVPISSSERYNESHNSDVSIVTLHKLPDQYPNMLWQLFEPYYISYEDDCSCCSGSSDDNGSVTTCQVGVRPRALQYCTAACLSGDSPELVPLLGATNPSLDSLSPPLREGFFTFVALCEVIRDLLEMESPFFSCMSTDTSHMCSPLFMPKNNTVSPCGLWELPIPSSRPLHQLIIPLLQEGVVDNRQSIWDCLSHDSDAVGKEGKASSSSNYIHPLNVLRHFTEEDDYRHLFSVSSISQSTVVPGTGINIRTQLPSYGVVDRHTPLGHCSNRGSSIASVMSSSMIAREGGVSTRGSTISHSKGHHTNPLEQALRSHTLLVIGIPCTALYLLEYDKTYRVEGSPEKVKK